MTTITNKITLGPKDLIQFITMTLVLSGLYWSMHNRVTILEKNLKNTNIGVLQEKIEHLDKTLTRIENLYEK